MQSPDLALECPVNVSEGNDRAILASLSRCCADVLLDVHTDPDHNRSVFTLGGPAAPVEAAVRALTESAVASLDLGRHEGAHPRFGVVDVVPFVPLVAVSRKLRRVAPLSSSRVHLAVTPSFGSALDARDRYIAWAAEALGLPGFSYGPRTPDGHRTLPEVRRLAWHSVQPDCGPARPHPTAGCVAVGARHFLVAYNVWVKGGDLALARSVAATIRGPAVRSMGFDLGGRPQVSCNLVDPLTIGPAQVYDQIARLLRDAGASVARAELVGLLPDAVLDAVPRWRWPELDLRPESTIEARLESLGIALA